MGSWRGGEVSSSNTSARGGHFVLGQLTHGSPRFETIYVVTVYLCGLSWYISIWSWAVMMMSVYMHAGQYVDLTVCIVLV